MMMMLMLLINVIAFSSSQMLLSFYFYLHADCCLQLFCYHVSTVIPSGLHRVNVDPRNLQGTSN